MALQIIAYDYGYELHFVHFFDALFGLIVLLLCCPAFCFSFLFYSDTSKPVSIGIKNNSAQEHWTKQFIFT